MNMIDIRQRYLDMSHYMCRIYLTKQEALVPIGPKPAKPIADQRRPRYTRFSPLRDTPWRNSRTDTCGRPIHRHSVLDRVGRGVATISPGLGASPEPRFDHHGLFRPTAMSLNCNHARSIRTILPASRSTVDASGSNTISAPSLWLHKYQILRFRSSEPTRFTNLHTQGTHRGKAIIQHLTLQYRASSTKTPAPTETHLFSNAPVSSSHTPSIATTQPAGISSQPLRPTLPMHNGKSCSDNTPPCERRADAPLRSFNHLASVAILDSHQMRLWDSTRTDHLECQVAYTITPASKLPDHPEWHRWINIFTLKDSSCSARSNVGSTSNPAELALPQTSPWLPSASAPPLSPIQGTHPRPGSLTSQQALTVTRTKHPHQRNRLGIHSNQRVTRLTVIGHDGKLIDGRTSNSCLHQCHRARNLHPPLTLRETTRTLMLQRDALTAARNNGQLQPSDTCSRLQR